MTPFGSKVRSILVANNLTAEWLSEQTGLTKSTISDWMTKTEMSPRPATVKKVVKALAPYVTDARQLATDLANFAGYAFVPSKDETDREARRREAMRANPRLAKHLDKLIGMDGEHQDDFLSFSESWNGPTRRLRKGQKESR